MNNLKYFRTIANLTRKELSSLMNVTVYTYQGYEDDRMVMRPETVILVSMIYNIDKDDIFCPENDVSEDTLEKLNKLAVMQEKERYNQLIYNLTGDKKDKIGYKQVNMIIKEIRTKLQNGCLENQVTKVFLH